MFKDVGDVEEALVNVMERTILLLGVQVTLYKVDSRDIAVTYSKAASITEGLYFLETSSDLRTERFARRLASQLSILLCF